MNNHHDPIKFKSLMDRYYSLNDQDTDYAWELLAKALRYAPPAIAEAMHNKLVELDMLPKVTLVDDDGNAVFTAQQIADHLKIPLDEVIEKCGRMVEDDPEVFMPAGNVHRLQ